MRPPTVRRSSGAPSLRAGAAAHPGRLEPAECASRPARAGRRAVEPQVAVQPAHLARASSEPAGRAGSSAGPPQDLVGEQVAEPGDARLVHAAGP